MTMSRFTTLLAPAAALLLLAGAVQAAEPALSLGAPRLVRTAEGVSLRGAVCRAGPVRVAGRLTASLDRLNAAGGPAASQPLFLTGAASGRGPGCGYYDVAVSEADSRLAVCAATPEGDRACRPVE
jgi:hypothetical protein